MVETVEKPRNKGGRPTNASKSKRGPKGPWKMTSDTIRKLEQAFSIDATIEEACLYAGITAETYHKWKRENPKLSENAEQLRKTPILAARQRVAQRVSEDDNMARWFLERKRKKEFGTEVDPNDTRQLARPILIMLAEQKQQNDAKVTKEDIIEGEIIPEDTGNPGVLPQATNIMDGINA